MQKQTLKAKRVHPDAVLPTYATSGAACFDLCAVDINGYTEAEHQTLQRAGVRKRTLLLSPGANSTVILRTGLAFEVPDGHVLMIFSRSGHGFNSDVRLSNCVGIIDSDYRGEVKVKLRIDGDFHTLDIRPGDRIAQAMLVPIPAVEIVDVDELSETERGAGGFGSTGS